MLMLRTSGRSHPRSNSASLSGNGRQNGNMPRKAPRPRARKVPRSCPRGRASRARRRDGLRRGARAGAGLPGPRGSTRAARRSTPALRRRGSRARGGCGDRRRGCTPRGPCSRERTGRTGPGDARAASRRPRPSPRTRDRIRAGSSRTAPGSRTRPAVVPPRATSVTDDGERLHRAADADLGDRRRPRRRRVGVARTTTSLHSLNGYVSTSAMRRFRRSGSRFPRPAGGAARRPERTIRPDRCGRCASRGRRESTVPPGPAPTSGRRSGTAR